MIKKYLLLVIAGLFIYGCVPTKEISDERSISADRLLKRVEANRRKVKTFLGIGTLDIKSSEINAKSNFEVKIVRPDSVTISLFGPFGIDLARINVNNKDFVFLDVINNRVYKGKVGPGVIKQVLKIDIQFDELINLLTGSVNLSDKLSFQPEAKLLNENNYSVEINDDQSNTNFIYTINSANLAISEFKIIDDSKSLFSAEYSDILRYDDVPVARSIKVNDIRGNQKINVMYRKVEINKNVGSLKIEIPEDAEITNW